MPIDIKLILHRVDVLIFSYLFSHLVFGWKKGSNRKYKNVILSKGLRFHIFSSKWRENN